MSALTSSTSVIQRAITWQSRRTEKRGRSSGCAQFWTGHTLTKDVLSKMSRSLFPSRNDTREMTESYLASFIISQNAVSGECGLPALDAPRPFFAQG